MFQGKDPNITEILNNFFEREEHNLGTTDPELLYLRMNADLAPINQTVVSLYLYLP